MLRVGRPGKLAGIGTTGGVCFGVSRIVAVAEAELFDAVRGQAMLHDGAVLGILSGLPEIGRVHDPEVGVLGIDTNSTVRGDRGEGGVLLNLILLLFRYVLQGAGREVIFKMEDLLLGPARGGSSWSSGRSAAFFRLGGVGFLNLVLGAADVEGENLVVLKPQSRYGNMLGVEGILCDLGQFHRKPLKVEDFGLCSLDGIHDVIVSSLWRLPFVPETVSVLEPPRLYPGGEDHLVHPLGREPFCKAIVGLGDPLLSCCSNTHQSSCCNQNSPFHVHNRRIL